MKVAVSGRIYSDNFGDAAIMESSRFLASSWPETTQVLDLDLDGRTRPPAQNRDGRPSLAKRVHRKVYASSPLYGAFFNHVMHLRRGASLEKVWGPVLDDSDLVVIGGGQLIQSSRLFFPLRINKLVRMAQDSNTPVAFMGVGVGSVWSTRMRQLYKQALSSSCVHVIGCRDQSSCDRLSKEIPQVASKLVTVSDLALALPLFAGPQGPADAIAPGTGIGIAPLHPNAIKRIGVGGPLATEHSALTYWTAVIKAAEERFGDVHLFTTGTKEDLVFVNDISNALPDLKIPIYHPSDMAGLYSFIKERKAIIAGRLHGSILSWVALKPLQGLFWDPKVKGFAENVNDLGSFFDANTDPQTLLNRLDNAAPLSKRLALRDKAIAALVAGYDQAKPK